MKKGKCDGCRIQNTLIFLVGDDFFFKFKFRLCDFNSKLKCSFFCSFSRKFDSKERNVNEKLQQIITK